MSTTARDSAAGETAAAGRPDARTAPADIWAAVAEYANAIEARNLARLEHVYPQMTEQQRRGWAAFFGSVTDLHTSLTLEQMTIAGATAEMRVRVVYEYENQRPHRAERRPVNTKLTLARDASGWRVRSVE